MFKHLLLTAICATALSCGATTLDFGKITHWAGEGDARAALVMLFDGQKTAQVWGFRWNSSASKPSGSDMVKAIAGASTDFDAMIQWTNFGYTLSGAGFSFDHAVMNYLRYDFEGAVDDGNISFGYYTPNTGMGQTGAPGAATQEICNRAIEEARKTHIIEHPLSHREYGYSAYDYDHWQLDANAPQTYYGVPDGTKDTGATGWETKPLTKWATPVWECLLSSCRTGRSTAGPTTTSKTMITDRQKSTGTLNWTTTT